MRELLKKLRLKFLLFSFAAVSLLLLYSYFISDAVETRITDAQMTKVDGKFMIATEYRPFVNYDAKYRLKFNSGTVQNDAIRLKGKLVMVRKYGWRIPVFSSYENIVSVEEIRRGRLKSKLPGVTPGEGQQVLFQPFGIAQ